MDDQLSYECPERPPEGSYDSTVPTVEDIVTEIIGIISGIASLISFIQGHPAVTVGIGMITVPTFCAVLYYQKCLKKVEGLPAQCMAGVVDSLEAPMSSNLLPIDEVTGYFREWGEQNTDMFPFLREHPSFTLVVKCKDWPRVRESAGHVWYNGVDPIVTCYVRDPELCAKLGLMIATSAVGAVAGYVAAVAVTTSLAAVCTASVICGVIALVIVAGVTIVASLLGAKLGDVFGGLGQVQGGDPLEQEPADEDAPGVRRVLDLREGDIVAVRGNLALASWLHNARTFWFVEEIFWYGREVDEAAPFSHRVADRWLTISEVAADGTRQWRHLEAAFCQSGLGGGAPSTEDPVVESTCIDFEDVSPDESPSTPLGLRHGWILSSTSDQEQHLRFVVWGTPAGTVKLLVSAPVRVTFDRAVQEVVARVGWEGGSEVELVAVGTGGELGRVAAPKVKDMVHTLTIVAAGIEAVELVGQEGLLIQLCVTYEDHG